jgi:anthranilate synthase component I
VSLQPDLAAFAEAWERGENQLVWTRLVADLDTPVSLMLKLTEARRDSFLLESVTGGEVRGRYSIMGMKPDLSGNAAARKARINRAARHDADAWTRRARPMLASLRADSSPRAASRSRPAAADGRRPLRLSRLRHGPPRRAAALDNPDPLGLPDAVLLRPTSSS